MKVILRFHRAQPKDPREEPVPEGVIEGDWPVLPTIGDKVAFTHQGVRHIVVVTRHLFDLDTDTVTVFAQPTR
jgi:hypothetical protein